MYTPMRINMSPGKIADISENEARRNSGREARSSRNEWVAVTDMNA
jgi:hypothetical protein